MKSVLCVLLLLWSQGDAFAGMHRLMHQMETTPEPEDPSEALFLSPYIEAGKITEGQRRARVHLNGTDVNSYSGLITVNKKYDSNMFFWFFEAENGDLDAPIIIWLQGGPGCTSLYGLFAELGPFYVGPDMKLIKRDYAWSSTFSSIFIDQPVGTGFSFTKSDKGYPNNQEEVGRDLYAFLVQFYKLFPHMQKNELYVTGESYAGKYVPTLTHYIHQQNKHADFKINIKGMAVGNGNTDPESMTNYGDLLYQIGLVDRKGREMLKHEEKRVKEFIKNEEWEKAVEADNNETNLYMELAGISNYFNFLQPPPNISEKYWMNYINQTEVKHALHMGDRPFNNGHPVYAHLWLDQSKSVKPWVVTLLNNDYKILYYNGQLDIIVAYTLTEDFLWSLDDWKLIDEYKNSSRNIWKVDGEVAGYEKKIGNFQQVLVRNCGHMVPMDQPKWGFDMLYRFIMNKPFH